MKTRPLATPLRSVLGFAMAGLCLTASPTGQAQAASTRVLTVSLPSAQTPGVGAARALVRRALPALSSLELLELVGRAGSTSGTWRFRVASQGVPILGRAVTLKSERGRAVVRSLPLPRLPASVEPRVLRPEALRLASAAARLDYGAEELGLVLLPLGGEARLAWRAYRPAEHGVPYAPLTLVDAVTGETLVSVNAVRFDRRATVHEFNPVSTPNPVEVELHALDPLATRLTGAHVEAFNCVDNGGVTDFWGTEVHVCDAEQTALADASGDFPYEYTAGSDTDPADPHAEVAMFFHLSQAYEAMRALGMPPLANEPLGGVANVRFPSGPGRGAELTPLDNAFFSPPDEYIGKLTGRENGGLFFGQGTFGDFSYDGDVVFHEFGHAALDRTLEPAPYARLDEQGALAVGGTIGEALADYLSATVSGDASIGEYAGAAFGLDGGAIRRLGAGETCPRDLVGEEHADSLFFSGPLWTVRASLDAAKRPAFDTAVMAGLIGAPSGDVALEELAELFVDEVGASEALGPDVAAALTQAYTAAGVLPRCERVVELALGVPHEGRGRVDGFMVAAPGSIAAQRLKLAPAPLQFRIALPAGATSLEVRGALSAKPASFFGAGRGDGAPVVASLLVAFGPEPLRFDAGVARSGESLSLGDSATFRETLEVPAGATEAHFMVLNGGESELLVQGVEARASGPDLDGPDSPDGPDGPEGASGAPALEPLGARSSESDACGCSVPGRSRGWGDAVAGLAGLVALGAGAWRRRAQRLARGR